MPQTSPAETGMAIHSVGMNIQFVGVYIGQFGGPSNFADAFSGTFE